MNGATPPEMLLPPAASREQAIDVEREAIDYVLRTLSSHELLALDREGEQWAAEYASAWKALCKQIVLMAAKLETLEERARKMLESAPGWPIHGLAMGRTIGSGSSILGIGDPLGEMKQAAIAEGIVSESEIRRASDV